MKKIEGYLYSDNTRVSIEIENGLINKISNIDAFENESNVNTIIAPALIDNQVNGYLGIEFSLPTLTTNDMLKVVNEHYKNGVATFLPTVITASHEFLIKSFSNMASTLKNSDVAKSVPGFHLEGPFISPEDGYRGAHSLEHIRLPDWDEFQKLNEIAKGKIIQVTLAPEVDGAIDFIKKCVENNIVVSLGHHNANADEIKRAVDAGAKTVTHLGNGCANNINRFNNPLWMQLAEDRLMSSLIVDGFHLLPEIVKVFYKAKGSERIILTSDMTMLAGLSPGNYKWDGKDVVLSPEGIILLPEENIFAGASLPLITGVGNMMRFTDCGLEEAINMATRNPAKLYKFEDRGSIEVGKRADFILLNLKDNKLNVSQTVVRGQVKYDVNK
ncbi:MAG: N-acetylglucosamine-6-phosphate deacetylase [Bacteroidota bacterium]